MRRSCKPGRAAGEAIGNALPDSTIEGAHGPQGRGAARRRSRRALVLPGQAPRRCWTPSRTCRPGRCWMSARGPGSSRAACWSAALPRRPVCVDTGYAQDREEVVAGRPLSFCRAMPATRAATVLLMDVLEHVADDCGLLHDAIAGSAPGSRVIVTVPAFGWLWSGHDVFLGHHRRYTLTGVEAAAAQGGAAGGGCALPLRCGSAARRLRAAGPATRGAGGCAQRYAAIWAGQQRRAGCGLRNGTPVRPLQPAGRPDGAGPGGGRVIPVGRAAYPLALAGGAAFAVWLLSWHDIFPGAPAARRVPGRRSGVGDRGSAICSAAPWTWPPLLAPALGAHGTNVALTDSIPLALLVLKPLRALLPPGASMAESWLALALALQAGGGSVRPALGRGAAGAAGGGGGR